MDETLRLDLPLLLPEVPDARDACVHRLTESLETREGVERAHIRDTEDGRGAELCIHYDPGVLPLARIRQIADGVERQRACTPAVAWGEVAR